MLSTETEKIVDNIAQKYGVPKEVWKPIALLESGGEPTKRNYVSPQRAKELGQGAEDSRGLFQINIFAHPNANSSRLYDPAYNAEYAFKNTIAPAYNEAKEKGLSGFALTSYVERYGQRPKWTSDVENVLSKNYSQVTGETPQVQELGFFDKAKDALTPDIDIWGNLRLISVNVFLFVLVVFGVYMAFRNEQVEKALVKGGTALATGGESLVADLAIKKYTPPTDVIKPSKSYTNPKEFYK